MKIRSIVVYRICGTLGIIPSSKEFAIYVDINKQLHVKMKIVSLVLIAFVILLTSFLVPTKAIGVGGSRSKRDGESCVVEDLQNCFEIITSGSMMSTTCCEKLKEKQSCLCSYIKTPENKRILSSRRGRVYLSSCGIPYPSC